MPTKKTVKKTPTPSIKAVVLHEVSLSEKQQLAVEQRTPSTFIKVKPGPKGRSLKYVETGYVVNRLNATFSPVGWDFEILEQEESTRTTEKNTDGEVWVRGKLTIIDHKNGFRVSKTQYGQHPVHKNIPIGNAFKAAASDCLKKCASLFGIAHDIYWGIDEEEATTQNTAKNAGNSSEKKFSVDSLKRAINTWGADALIRADENIQKSKHYTDKQKAELHKLITARVEEIDSKQA